jgi:hypothetical protein
VDEAVEPSFGKTFSDILDGFPVLMADDSTRYYFHPCDRVDMLRFHLPMSIRRGFIFLGGCSSGGSGGWLVFCFLPSFSGIGFVGGVLVLEVCAMRVELADGVICRDLETDDDSFVVFLCVGFRIFWESICAVSIHAICVAASIVTHDLAAAVLRSLGGCTGGDGKSFAGVLTPLVGLLFVIWGWPVRRPVSDSGDDEETTCCRVPECSMDQKHALCVLLMGLLKF